MAGGTAGTRIAYLSVLGSLLSGSLILAGCESPALGREADQRSGADERGENSERAPRGRSQTPAGSTCQGRGDCATDQICVNSICRHEAGSVAAEVLTAGARAQLEAGDVSGALSSFEEAVRATEREGVNVPPETACGAAQAALRNPTDADGRERAARYADRCFRNSLPGDPLRVQVQRDLARHRYDGLSLRAFDEDPPPEEFFSNDPTRPTADAIEVTLGLPASERPAFEELRRLLELGSTRAEVNHCFVADWDLRHERRAEAALLLSYQSVLRDMGAYDLFEPRVRVRTASGEQEGFSDCVAQSLTAILEPGPRLERSVSMWQIPFSVRARTR